jgi:hypothetical protein
MTKYSNTLGERQASARNDVTIKGIGEQTTLMNLTIGISGIVVRAPSL